MVNGAREAALGTALRDDSDPTATLEEYAWRSLIARVRVRDYCEGATFAVCASSVNHVRVAITHTPTRLLFPYDLAADAPSGAHTPQIHSHSHSSSTLNAITRKQVVDVIVRLVRERGPIEARVVEVMLEYIGHKWNSSEGDVDIVAKKLFEIVSDVEANEPNKCTGAVATIQRLRFQLGLVSAAQLASRLNSLPAFIRDSSALDVNQFIHAWAVRRLNASQLPQFVADALFNLRETLNHAPHREVVGSVLKSFGLDGRRLSGKESPPRRNRGTSRSFQSSPRISPTKRRTMPFPHWLPRTNTRFNGEERRPSLPTLLVPAEPAHISWPIPMQGQDAGPPRSPDGSPCNTPTPTAGTSQAASSQLALLDPSNVRTAVVDQILELRYRLGADADGWFLGTGQDKAADILNHFPGCEELRDTIVELRRIFHLPDPAVSNKLGLTILPLNPRVDSLAAERPRIGLHVTTPSLDTVPVIHERDVSFDLDQYMADLSHSDPDTSGSTVKADELTRVEVAVANDEDNAAPLESPGLLVGPGLETRSSISSEVSRFSFTSSSSALSGGRRGSTISDFVICEAVRVAVDHGFPFRTTEYPVTIDTSPKSVPRHSKSLSMLSDPDMYTRVPELRSRRNSHRHHAAMPSLSAPLSKTEFDFKTMTESDSGDSQGNNPVPLISPTPKVSPPGVDFSISPLISPVSSPMGTARPTKEFRTVISRPPSPPPEVESSSSARERSYQRLSTSPIDRAGSRTPTVASPEGRSRRHRQMVIVDGEPISPGSNKTPLGVVLTMFSQRKNLTPDAVEQILGQAVRVEEERMTAQDEEFDAEARVRLAWLLEQVANELSQAELIAAVQRVLCRLSNKDIPVRRPPSSSTSYSTQSSPTSSYFAINEDMGGSARTRKSPQQTHQQRSPAPPPPPSSFGSRMYGRKDLTITVPPRARSTIKVTSSPPSSPSVESASWTYSPSPDMTSDSSPSLYSSSSLYSTTMSTAVSTGFNMTASSEESFSTSPVSVRRAPSSKPPMVRFPNYTRGMGTPLQRQKSGATYSTLSGKQRMSLVSSPNSSPLTPCTPDQMSGSFESFEAVKAIRRSPLRPQPPKVSPPIPLTDVHAL